MGLGLHGGGVGAARFFAKAGARVLVTDLRKKELLQESIDKLKGLKIKFALGQHRSEDFINTDYVIKNPAVPENSKYLEIAKKHKVKIESDIGIFFELCKNKKIGITGTKGKSTTTKLIFDLVKTRFKNAILAGNIRSSVLSQLKKIVPKNPIVLELSSWQLHDLGHHKKSPSIAVILNLLDDHQNRYKTYAHYVDDKKNIIKYQKRKSFAVLNHDDPRVRELRGATRAQVLYFSLDPTFEKQVSPEQRGAYLKDGMLVFGSTAEKIIEAKEVPLAGKHNLSNVAAAITVAKILELPDKAIKKTIINFEGLPGRAEIIAHDKKRLAINDTTATTPDGTVASLEALIEKYSGRPLTLILGGTDKKLNFSSLAKKLKELEGTARLQNIVFLPGDATEKIKTELKKIDFPWHENKIIDAFTMSDAVKLGVGTMDDEGILLLSPAAASFGLFLHEFDRGEKFNQAIKKYF